MTDGKRSTKVKKPNTATARVSRRSKSKRRNDNRFMIALIIIVVSIVSSVFVININSSRKKLAELNEQKQKLQAEYDRQLKLAEELEKKKVYVKTNAYIEEQARKLGLIYPNEVIFKPSN